MGKINDALKKAGKESKVPTSAKKDSLFKVYDRKARENRSTDVIKTVFKKRDADKNLVSFFEPESFEAEQFKHLRTNILFPVSGRRPRSIMVTSAVPGEGKSFVASNLAVSIAQNIDQHVLLMDCDIRKATIHNNFGFDDVAGLTEYLSKDMSLSSLLLKTEINKLTILPGGKHPHNPAELMSSNQMSKLLKEVTSRYSNRYIIIDSPPPHLTSETSVIARQVDGILLVVKAGSTSRELVKELLEMMGKEKVIGVVVNWFDMRSMKYSGYGKHSRYKKYYGKS
ncbi:MAG: polysaccharide biosynthesis tyrosine autokinase [Thermodesulfobacteriota bacterium]|nr:polysaccharide biosynthesis tyrosine autokinase [Thermodesulfobacteriota bacterium]